MCSIWHELYVIFDKIECMPYFKLLVLLWFFYLLPGGGAHTLEGSMGMCCPQDPFFQAIFYLQRPTISSPFPAPETPTSIFLKNLVFSSPIFAKFLAKFQLQRHKFLQKFVPETPVSSQKISSGDPTFENLGGTYLPKTFSTTSPMPLARCNYGYLQFA